MWLDPNECEAAQQYLAADNPAAAAKVLLASPAADHAAGRALLLECQTRFIALAEQALAVGHLQSCQELLDQAVACGPLPGPAATLPERLRKAQERLQSTLPFTPPPPGAANRPRSESSAPAPGETPIVQRSQRLALGREALIVSEPVVLLGRKSPPATLAISRTLRSRHAWLRRNDGAYWLERHEGLLAQDYVGILAGKAEREVLSSQRLHDGDQIVLGDRAGQRRCPLRFRLPSGSTSAVLEADYRDFHTMAGDFDRVVLLDKTLDIGPGAACHAKLGRPGAPNWRLTWTPTGLLAECDHGLLFRELDGDWPDPPSPLVLPLDLHVNSDVALSDHANHCVTIRLYEA